MAAAVKARGKQSRVITRSIQIQSTTHQEIIDLGDELFLKASDKQRGDFRRSLARHEQRLIERLEKEKKNAIACLEREHQDELERMKCYYIDLQNEALKDEASRVKDIMDKVANRRVNETSLEGQKKLDEALIDARVRFDTEKSTAIEEIIRQQEEIAENQQHIEYRKHEEDIQKLNEEWKNKMKTQEEEGVLNLQQISEQQLKEMNEMFEKKLKESLLSIEDEHKCELTIFNNEIQQTENQNDHLHEEIELLKGTLDETKTNMLNVLGAFKQFVEESPGFGKGQSEYLLDQLVPQKLVEFLRNT